MIVENFYLNTAIILLASYFIGAFPSAYIAGRIKGISIYKTGTGNVGGMNAISSVGLVPGIIVTIIDIGKGSLIAFLASKFSGHSLIPLWAVVAVVVGHNWMVYIGFRGGKGVATFLGGLLFLSPWSILFLYLIIIPIAMVSTKDSYLSTTIGLFVFGFFVWIWEGSVWWLLFSLLITLAYGIKCASLLKSYFTSRRRDIYPLIKKMFRPFFKNV